MHRPALVLAASAALALGAAGSAPGHPPAGCSASGKQPRVGSVDRVYTIGHGCVRLRVPADDTKLPTVVVRRHGSAGRPMVRRFALPRTNLPPGAVGICGRSSWYLFLVSYPFVTVVAQPLYEEGPGERACSTGADEALLWTLELTPGLRGLWHTHRP